MSIGNKFTIGETFFQPQNLIGLSYADINRKLQDENSDLAREIYGSANYITAAICSTTDNKPANVCTPDPIPAIQATLNSSAHTPQNKLPLTLFLQFSQLAYNKIYYLRPHQTPLGMHWQSSSKDEYNEQEHLLT